MPVQNAPATLSLPMATGRGTPRNSHDGVVMSDALPPLIDATSVAPNAIANTRPGWAKGPAEGWVRNGEVI
jgi:hypothetical protein